MTKFSFLAIAKATALSLALIAPLASAAQAQDAYDFENAYLSMAINRAMPDETAGNVTYANSISLGQTDATLTITVTVITDVDYYMVEFLTSGDRGLNEGGGLGYSMALWPYSSVWMVRRNDQAIYAGGYGLDGMIADLEARFNGAEGQVRFFASGDTVSGGLVITMQN